MALLRESLRSVRARHGDNFPPPLLPARMSPMPAFAQRPVALTRKRLPGIAPPKHSWTGADGVRLAADSWGAPDAPLVILLHGIGQTRHAWSETGRMLGDAGYCAVAYDARGHGDSDWASDCDYSRDAMVRDLQSLVAALGGRPPALVGASIGGATSLVAVGEGQVLATSLVLADFAPWREGSGIARIRSFMNKHAAGFSSLEEVADAMASYHQNQLMQVQEEMLACSVRLDAEGRVRWHWDPLLMARPRESQERRAAAARNLALPTLLLRGGQSDVIGEQNVQDFRAVCPHLEYTTVVAADHKIAADRNDIFGRAAMDFLQRAVPAVLPPHRLN